MNELLQFLTTAPQTYQGQKELVGYRLGFPALANVMQGKYIQSIISVLAILSYKYGLGMFVNTVEQVLQTFLARTKLLPAIPSSP